MNKWTSLILDTRIGILFALNSNKFRINLSVLYKTFEKKSPKHRCKWCQRENPLLLRYENPCDRGGGGVKVLFQPHSGLEEISFFEIFL